MKPKIEDAPGLHWKPRKDGWEARWECRPDIAKKGYMPKSSALWVGVEPNELERKMIADACNRLQSEMLVFNSGGIPIVGTGFDGTVTGLIRCYQTDPDSSYHKLRYHVRRNHDDLLRRIIKRHGDTPISEIKARLMLSWHKLWSDDGKKLPTGHLFVGQMRTLFTFGKTILEDAECTRISSIMSDMRFPMSKARTERLTAAQANAIRKIAHEQGWHSIALAQAFQFECTLRQKDVIGEWIPMDEPGLSDVKGPKGKWLRGLRWEEIDENLVLRHTTSKKNKLIVVDLKLAPMVLEELKRLGERGTNGPIIVCEFNGQPYVAADYRRRWRDIANAAGLPKTVWSMDTRSGAISEATDAGAELELVRHAAAHSQASMTARYSRGSEEKIAKVMQLRVKHRGGTDDGRE